MWQDPSPKAIQCARSMPKGEEMVEIHLTALSLALDWKFTWPAVYCTYQPVITGVYLKLNMPGT